ncbi:MAG: Uncharacterized protein G01um101413_286 [Parcubacteria group bacterium Gr01-1014_13]|nr:MAG: Uncharacterized protein G01um101413_286 [Parcubacteria group bacterium Gr01-1014_13]
MLKSLSFHPKLAAVLDLLVNLVMLWWLRQFHSWWLVGVWLLFRLAIWGALMWLVYYPAEMSRYKHIASLVVMVLGSLSFLLFIEWRFAWYLFGALFCFFSFFSFWLLPASSVSLATFLKPHLRWRFIMSVIGLAGVFQAAGAIISFQIAPGINSWVWYILASLFSTFVAGWWWWEYGVEENKRFWIWVGCWFVMILELLWVIGLLPIGYLTGTLVLIWCWYVVWLLARFNLSPEGINWRKQVWFLSFNAVLFPLFLFFIIRWK